MCEEFARGRLTSLASSFVHVWFRDVRGDLSGDLKWRDWSSDSTVSHRPKVDGISGEEVSSLTTERTGRWFGHCGT